MNEVKHISYQELQYLLKKDTTLIDIREPDEHKIAHITGSINIPKDLFTQALLNNLSNKNIVLYCRSGNRCSMLLQNLKLNDNQKVYHLTGGISALSNDVLSSNTSKKILPIMQQVQIAIGLLIIASYMLAFFINYNFIYLPFILACGLIFAGISGFCGLAKIVSMMPWNKIKHK